MATAASESAPAGREKKGDGSGLQIGITPVILSEQAAFLARWADYLSRRLGKSIRFIVRNDYRHILDLLFEQHIDAAWICGYPYVLFRHRLALLATPLYQGAPTYNAYLIRKKNSDRPIQRWEDLDGRVLAYADPLSNSGWLVAQAELARAFGDRARFALRTFFAHSHRNVVEAVATGLADAGSVDGYVWDTLHQQHWPPAQQTEVVWRSPAYGFPPLVALQAAPAEKVRMLRAALLNMRADAEGQRLLQALNLDGFVIPSDHLYDGIAQLARQHTPMRPPPG